MVPKLLILGGTTEGNAVAQAVAKSGFAGVVSLAGRVAQPRSQPLPVRIGGFGGVNGLAEYLQADGITHVIDATHPFAAQMSAHAVAACAECEVPLIALTRPAWEVQHGDAWQRAGSIPEAVARLDGPGKRVFLAIGRMNLADFAAQPQHHYVLRLVDPPEVTLPFPSCEVIVARGPFDLEADLTLLRDHRIDLVVSKNSGGTGAYAKIAAARALGVPVLMIDRPHIPARHEVGTLDEVLDWLGHAGTERGV